ncbi:hypothetical protein ACVJGD_004783 [Bradyrhizobium sp. USDA 10063]
MKSLDRGDTLTPALSRKRERENRHFPFGNLAAERPLESPLPLAGEVGA